MRDEQGFAPYVMAVQAECDVLIHRGPSTVYLDPHGVNLLADGQRTLLDPRGWSSWFPPSAWTAAGLPG